LTINVRNNTPAPCFTSTAKDAKDINDEVEKVVKKLSLLSADDVEIVYIYSRAVNNITKNNLF
jgi:hypothetical protein